MNNVDLAERVSTVRAFNRLYTGVIGVLDEGPADAEYSLSEARVLFELSRRDRTPVPDLRKRLDLDPGYASRLLGRLESRGLVARSRCADDGRRQVVELTEHGRAAFRILDQRSVSNISSLLGRFDEDQQQRLLRAMATITDVVAGREERPTLVLRPPRPGDLGWVVQRHGDIYAREYGWDAGFEAMVAKIVADYVEQHDPRREAVWIAELDGERVGSIACVRGSDEQTAKLRLLLVEPTARGYGVGRRLVTECVEFARSHGYTAMELLTVDLLAAARKLYQDAGFQLIDQNPSDDFGHRLVWQTWRLEFPPC
ncbi:bifunctional helix-turn-helix transcriptional regulator/GNAT family N-acetyltransferase [Amycolatopsis suaedae]|uniref:MarR family transcriptional regulator n=1 Tax=Amycolatopsis suaedae TaxID=2510978 RepID=A0A4Q7JDI5_9PSEU|nr:bifunctional helix-turn-helix transcriptional regulator/GNAT family N-acetyltransferase [Amycolatopsis suaedae]RZQ65106.1 MarR family transcriptional regulator [Amycolatopsis suaedae]